MTGHPLDWLTLLRAPGVGPATFARLLGQFEEPARVLRESAGALEAAGLKRPAIDWLQHPDTDLLRRDLDWLAGDHHSLITLHDADYPPLLADIANPPPLLFVTGERSLLTRPQLALVGSRNPTTGGRRNAEEFARFFAGAGITVTSGLATGIDGAAHKGALETGTTIAVVGTGPDRVYPARHRDLAHRIAAGGALVSEFPPGTEVRREHFPRRNRIISGLSLGTLVVEAAARSGSLITARLAAEQGREVFAIPGSIHNPLAKGCHALIRQGAKLVETGQDVIDELGALLGSLSAASALPPQAGTASEEPGLDADYAALLACLGHDPVTTEGLMQCSGFSADVISSMLLMLELEGLVAAVPGGRYCRTERADSPPPDEAQA